MMQRIDDLIVGGFRIYQEKGAFRFGTDAVLLYGIIPADCGKVADLCSGNGAVALMLAGGRKSDDVTAVELQGQALELLQKSILLNGCETAVHPLCADIRKIKDFLFASSFDTVCVNPPYFPKGSGLLPPDERVAIARHELQCNIDDVLTAAQYLLKEGGNLYMVHRTSRRSEILEKIHKYDLQCRELVTVFTEVGRESELFLLRAQKSSVPLPLRQRSTTVAAAYERIFTK